MEHFAEQPWVDFVRGVSGIELSRDIEAHLIAGCPECQTSHDNWSRVRRLASEEAAYEPPDNLLRLVKLGFCNKSTDEPQKWTLANLVFDSFTQPLQHGLRSGALNVGAVGAGGVSVWQVVHEAEGLTVDLRFSQRAQSKAMHLVGQVFDRQAVRPLQSSAIVELSTDEGHLITTSVVSALGEFHIECEAKGRLLLLVKATGRNIVRIPLGNLRLR
jgi:hypothetical protein